MMRSMASMPPLSGARSSKTASGWWATTAASAASAVHASAATWKPGPNSRLRRALVWALFWATTTTTSGDAVAEVSASLAGLAGTQHLPWRSRGRPAKSYGAGSRGLASSASPLHLSVRAGSDRRGRITAAMPRSTLHAPALEWYERHARDLPWRGPDATPWGCWSARSCSSRRRWPECCPSTSSGSPDGRGRPTSLPSRRARRCECGGGSAIPGGRSGCTRRRVPWSPGTAARCRRRTTNCSPCPASGATRRPRSRRSRSAGGMRCSTRTCAGSSPGLCRGRSSRRRT